MTKARKATAKETEEILFNIEKTRQEILKKDLKDLKAWAKEEFKGKVKKVKILEKTDILYAGWECDSDIWLVQLDKEVLVLGTDHGSRFTILSAGFLREKIIEYSKLNLIYVNWISKVTK